MITPKLKICRECGKECYLFSKGRCKACASKGYKKPKPVSDSLKREQKTYKVVRDVYIQNHPNCKAKLNGCTGTATEIHHKKGRVGKLLCDVRYFLSTCRNCHRWIEEHPKEAKELGLSLKRLVEN